MARYYGLSSSRAIRALHKRCEEPSSPIPIDWPLIRLLAAISIGLIAVMVVAYQNMTGG